MNPNQLAAFQAIQQAQQARKAGDLTTARRFAEQAASAAPELEEVWLMMAALAEPQASVEHLQRALQINPTSERAQKGMLWAMGRLDHRVSTPLDQRAAPPPEEPAAQAEPPHPPPAAVAPQAQAASVGEKTEPTRPVSAPIEAQPARPKAAIPVSHPKTVEPSPLAQPAKTTSGKRRISLAAILALLTCLVAGAIIAYTASPVSALFARETHGPAWALAEVSKSTATASPEPTATTTFTLSPTATRTATATLTVTPSLSPSPTITETFTPTETPTSSVTPTATEMPSITPTEEASPTPLPTDTALPTRVVPTSSPAQVKNPNPVPGAGGERWIDVNLSQQMVYAYEGDTLVASFVVSTGTWQYPTVTGQYRVYIKYRYKDMSGPGYFLPDVPYTMFFYAGYAIHGTYWHSNFGTPMSHGCVNLTIPDAEWLYNFASVGTLVNVHY